MSTAGVLLYAVLGVGALVLLVVFAWLYGNADPDEPAPPVEDVLEAARLVGGPDQVTLTALAALHAAGLVGVDVSGALVAQPGAVGRNRVERAVLDACATVPHGELRPLFLKVARGSAVRRLDERLAGRGLLLSRRGGRWLRGSAAAYAILCVVVQIGSVPLMLVITDMADADGRELLPLWLLPGFLCGLLVASLVGGRAGGAGLTSAGRAAIAAYRAEAHRANALPAAGPALAVALHGASRIPDPVLAAMLAPRPSAPSSPPPMVYTPPPPPAPPSTY
ncbi:TIGR04222 domain-containing membrane protein [Streptomyces sp. NPDC050400]|uniref:TIGR04222 domain-containing membrane protein n=1 Tax=Streptomyces sp. NPDC050400 TaxID=3365610 RepID=UPI00378B1029